MERIWRRIIHSVEKINKFLNSVGLFILWDSLEICLSLRLFILWDSSPNRELIHQVIEAFEEHLASGELQSSKKANNRIQAVEEAPVSESVESVVEAETVDAFLVAKLPPGDIAKYCGGNGEDLEQKIKVEREDDQLAPAKEDAVGVVRSPADGNHKVLARKVLPDVIGLLNSRL
ncbi:hypothetical protein Ancab_005697 [Ancistrocladus abbreviatus]